MTEIDAIEESGSFCVYNDVKTKLVSMGIPAEEIAFIHDAKNETQKAELFEKVRSGEVRVLLGSTSKMGTGTNIQDRVIALHDLDVPWRPADLEQRRGRMVRQGNINEKTHLYRYVTKGTFDAYSYQLLESKQRFISQAITSKTPARTCSDVDQDSLTYAEIKALCTADERIKEKLTLENRVKELNAFKREYTTTRFEMEDQAAAYPKKREQLLKRIERLESDCDTCRKIPFGKDGKPIFSMNMGGVEYEGEDGKKEAAQAFKEACEIAFGDRKNEFEVAEIYGFKVSVRYDSAENCLIAALKGQASYTVLLHITMHTLNIARLEKAVLGIEKALEKAKTELAKVDVDFEGAKKILETPFEYEQELAEKSERLSELNDELNAEAAKRLQDGKKGEQKTHYFGKDKILNTKNTVKKNAEPTRCSASVKGEAI